MWSSCSVYGFIISRHFLDPKYSKEELDIAISIATGSHGFGDKFTEENPFIIAPVEGLVNTRDSLSLHVLEEEAKEVAKKYVGRVIVQGLREARE